MARRGSGPCGCCGISLEHGSQIFAIYDIISGLLTFMVFGVMFLLGVENLIGGKGFFPSEKFSIPRRLVITFITLGYYNAATGLFLYFSAGCRDRILCWVWILLNVPMIPVGGLIKIYGMFVVYKLTKEIKQGITKTIKNDNEDDDTTNLKAGKGI